MQRYQLENTVKGKAAGDKESSERETESEKLKKKDRERESSYLGLWKREDDLTGPSPEVE